MFSYSMDPSAGILHLTVAGRATFEDFQEAMPGMLEALQSGSYPNFLLEIKNLDESESHVDPDLGFWAMNQIKIWIAKMAVVCPSELSEDTRPFTEIVRNYRKPVKTFGRLPDALRWLE